jgi:4-nitrophenyl phosphatase
VVGICLDLTYGLLNGGMQQIRSGAEFVATNPDATFPLEDGKIVPGAGSMVAAVQTCSGAVPFVVGKPNPYLVELALREAGVEPRNALAVGDRLDTDIESGRRAGCDTHLVLTGVESSAPEGQSFSCDLFALLE